MDYILIWTKIALKVDQHLCFLGPKFGCTVRPPLRELPHGHSRLRRQTSACP